MYVVSEVLEVVNTDEELLVVTVALWVEDEIDDVCVAVYVIHEQAELTALASLSQLLKSEGISETEPSR